MYAIRWNALNLSSSENVKIELGYNQTDSSYPGGTYNEDWIVEKTQNSGSYMWKIPEVYGMGMKESAFTIKITTASGAVDYSNGNFTIKLGVSNPTLSVSSPVAGATYTSGQVVAIKWNPASAGESVRFTLLRKGDSLFSRRINTYYDNSFQSWAVSIPTGLTGSDYFLRIETHRNGIPYGIGYSGVFSIVSSAASSITVLSPNGGEAWKIGSTYVIKWSSTGSIPIVDITTTNTPSTYIASSIPNSGSYAWDIPSDFPIGSYRLRIAEPTGGLDKGVDDSDMLFTVIPKSSVTVLSPNGGEKLILSSAVTLRWSSSPDIVQVFIEFFHSLGDDGGWMVADAPIANTGTFSWRVGDGQSRAGESFLAPGNYFAVIHGRRASDPAGTYPIIDYSATPFSILAAQ